MDLRETCDDQALEAEQLFTRQHVGVALDDP